MEINNTLAIYTISVVSKLTDVPIRMIREYEKQGLIKPRKINGKRLFSSCEVDFIRDIHYYLLERQMTIGGLREFYLRAACWEIKQCRHKDCPAYGNVDKHCWQIVSKDKKCDNRICPFCPIFIVKMARGDRKRIKLESPSAYPKK